MNSPDSAQPPGPSSRPAAATLEFREATKLYPGQKEPAVDALSLEVPAGRDLRASRPIRVREDDGHADGQPDDRHHRRRHPARRPQRPRAQAGRAAPRDRLRDPADRPVPSPDGRRQRRDGARACSAGRRTASRARVDELLELVSLDPRRDPRPLPGPALGRPAPARGRGARPGGGPAADADGRAVRRDRPDQPRAAAERVPAPAAGDPQDDRVRDPRHRRGDQDGRPHRDHAAAAASSPSTRRPRSC